MIRAPLHDKASKFYKTKSCSNELSMECFLLIINSWINTTSMLFKQETIVFFQRLVFMRLVLKFRAQLHEHEETSTVKTRS